ncbi:MAG: cysteine-rich small domain-containing protein, partial [Methanohalobium sp.]|uniref:cysteine-rich small domain-containing protein n=1 Tax=Methanohalobium sp. TaxID=2837493 RepID=UPI00397A7F1B
SSFCSLDHDFLRIAVRTYQETDKLAKNIGKAMTNTSRDRAKQKLEHRLNSVKGKSLVGSNTACPYYPCHYEGQDCTFCFCPFYPCGDERTGGKCIERSTGGKVWSCMNCYIVHDPEVAQEILDILKESGDMDKKIKKAWDESIKPRLSEK